MRLLDSLKTRQYYPLPEDTNLFHSFVQQTYGKSTEECLNRTFVSYADRGLGGNSVVFGIMLARMSLFTEATFQYRNRTTRKLFGTPDLGILETPWENGSTGDLLARMIQDVDLAGNSFIRNDGDQLVRLRPDWTHIVRVGEGELEDRSRWRVIGYGYHPTGPGGPEEFYPATDVAHWAPIPDPLATYRGMAWLTPVVREVNTDLAMTDYKRRFLDNSATPNIAVVYKNRLSPEAVHQVRELFDTQYNGTDGLKTAILDQGADLTVVGDSFASMDFTNVQAAGENRIAAAAGVPGIVVGLKEGLQAATYSNYGQAMRRFVDLTMRPLWRSACASLATIVPAQAGAELWYDVTDIAALRESEQDRANALSTKSVAAQNLINSGFDPASVVSALQADDLSLLVHSGLVSVQLQPPGTQPDTTTTPDTNGGASSE